MHQLQGYAAAFANMQSMAHLNVPSMGNGSSSSSPSGYHVPLPGTPSAQLPLMIPNGLMLPSPMYPSPVSPFFSHNSAQPSPQKHSHSPQPGSNVYSMLFPSANGSGSGTSSVDSLSPDATSAVFDRGRPRTRTQTAEARMASGGWPNEDVAVANDDESDNGFSGVLADAILKRPGSIHLAPKKKRRDSGQPPQDEQPIEFTFPSISSMGNPRVPERVWTAEAGTEDGWMEVEEAASPSPRPPVRLALSQVDPLDAVDAYFSSQAVSLPIRDGTP